MLNDVIEYTGLTFRTSEEVYPQIIDACKKNPDIASYYELGESEEGRPILGIVLGNGLKTVSLIAGAHSDEPVGPETLRTFIIRGLEQKDILADLFKNYRFVIVPHINPDGEARNQAWINKWPDLSAYLQHAFRELPGRDLEFGFPDMRIENRLVSQFLERFSPFSLHLSLHGMGYSEGAMLLIERNWIYQTTQLRSKFREYAKSIGLGLHDHDRKGEKGFQYIAPGFTTTPEGKAMQAHFRSLGDEETAKKFYLSSMEFVRSPGGDPLCLVTELPLFVIRKRMHQQKAGVPEAYLTFKNKVPELKKRMEEGRAIDNVIREFRIEALSLEVAVKFQLYIMQCGLGVI